MLADRTTLTRFLAEDRRRHPADGEDPSPLILEVAQACREIAARVALGALRDPATGAGEVNIQGEVQHALDVIANDHFLSAGERSGHVAGMASEELAEPVCRTRGGFLLVFDPLDGSSNIDVNVAVGSIFSVLRAPDAAVAPRDFLRPGTAQVCAGYALYGPATVLVLTVGRGVHEFTLDPGSGEFLLTRESVRIPRHAREFAVNVSNRRFWEPAVRRYVDECLAGLAGPRHKDFNMRWVASLVAEAHRILTRGGVFLYPRDTKEPAKPGRLRLLYEADPVAFLVEQAGGAASTGRDRVLDVVPSDLHQRVPLIFGAAEEVALIDRYHRQFNDGPHDSPLYGTRGLFRVAVG
jgi:fructose-1,6-bisphosphatase I/sedoheptulose-1,7-bisphosphatase